MNVIDSLDERLQHFERREVEEIVLAEIQRMQRDGVIVEDPHETLEYVLKGESAEEIIANLDSVRRNHEKLRFARPRDQYAGLSDEDLVRVAAELYDRKRPQASTGADPLRFARGGDNEAEHESQTPAEAALLRAAERKRLLADL